MVFSGHRAGREIESEAELGQELQLEAHDTRACMVRIEQAIEHVIERSMDLRVGVALWQHAAERSQMSDAVEGMRDRQERRRPRIEGLDRVVAEMFIEPRAPGAADAVTRLQHRPQPRARPSPHQTEMAAVGTRHQFEDGIGLPVTPGAEHDGLVSPFHR